MTIFPPQGRLSLSSISSVTASDIEGATTVYYVPALGNAVPVFDGLAFQECEIGVLACALSASYHPQHQLYDLFVFDDSGTVRLGTGPAWLNIGNGSAPNRGAGAGTTEVECKNGIMTNKNSVALRWGSLAGDAVVVAANQATLVGTISTLSGDGTTSDSSKNRLLSNVYNQVRRSMQWLGGGTPYNYNSNVWRAAGNVTRYLVFVQSLPGSAISAKGFSSFINTTDATYITGRMGIGLCDYASVVGLNTQGVSSNQFYSDCHALYQGTSIMGQQFFSWNEYGSGSGKTQQWPDSNSFGLYAEVFA